MTRCSVSSVCSLVPIPVTVHAPDPVPAPAPVLVPAHFDTMLCSRRRSPASSLRRPSRPKLRRGQDTLDGPFVFRAVGPASSQHSLTAYGFQPAKPCSRPANSARKISKTKREDEPGLPRRYPRLSSDRIDSVDRRCSLGLSDDEAPPPPLHTPPN